MDVRTAHNNVSQSTLGADIQTQDPLVCALKPEKMIGMIEYQ